jgi:hypothetical protein
LAASAAKQYYFWIAILTDFALQNQSEWLSKKFCFGTEGGEIFFTQPYRIFF